MNKLAALTHTGFSLPVPGRTRETKELEFIEMLVDSVPTLITAAGDVDVQPIQLAYDPSDPYAVTLTIFTESGDVEWVFARDLLRDALSDSVGQGDIRLRSDVGAVIIDLSSPSGEAQLECARRSVEQFISSIYDAVPDGSESGLADVDGWIQELLAP
ncbi:MAG: SsgA family sporulation/cell division regulator [Actinomycetia bacterium]|nr:SsgA family sporulation/cell division regulator [Actinomycetes bacterium]